MTAHTLRQVTATIGLLSLLVAGAAEAAAPRRPARVKPAATRTAGDARTAAAKPAARPRATTGRVPRTQRPQRATPALRAMSAVRRVTMKELPTSAARREGIAMRAVSGELRRRLGGKWDVTMPFSQFVGDTSNPITGSGPLEVYATQNAKPRGAWASIRRMLSPNAERRFIVMVDAQGQTTILSSRPHSLPYRAARAVIDLLPLAGDVFKSRGVRVGSLLSGGGLVAVTAIGGPVGLVIAGVLGLSGTNEMRDGVERRNEARADALDRTLHGWPGRVSAGSRHRHGRPGLYDLLKKKQTVTLTEAHNLYKLNLEDVKSGTTPLDIAEFATVLAANGL